MLISILNHDKEFITKNIMCVCVYERARVCTDIYINSHKKLLLLGYKDL